jgi:hypothetical protein
VIRHIETRKRKGGPWIVSAVWADGVSKILVGYRRKRDALIAGRAVAIYARCEHKWTDRHGEYQGANSYGNDPRNVKG